MNNAVLKDELIFHRFMQDEIKTIKEYIAALSEKNDINNAVIGWILINAAAFRKDWTDLNKDIKQ